jgi:glutamate 5-kinase
MSLERSSSKPSGSASVGTWQRAVIKVGSALVCPDGNGCSGQYLQAVSEFIITCKAQGKDVIIVSSGSIAAARSSIKTGLKPSIAEKQAMAAIGQMRMMANWTQLFTSSSASGSAVSSNEVVLPENGKGQSLSVNCAQILVTLADLADRKRFVNIKNTLEQLLANNAIPIVNENDTVAVDEIKVGDNDNLAAHTAIAVQADCLIICTDVDGLFDADPRKALHAKLIKEVAVIDEGVMALAGGAGSSLGTGGMITKLQAAQKCTRSGIETLLLNGTKSSSFDMLANGDCSGTIFRAVGDKQRARQDWLSHTSKTKGKVFVDAGALSALQTRGASLLAAGILRVEGKFNAGDNIEIVHANVSCGKGLANYSDSELKRIVGCKSAKIKEILGNVDNETVVHRDNLVLSPLPITPAF